MVLKKRENVRHGSWTARVRHFRTREGEERVSMPREDFELLDARFRLVARIMSERPLSPDNLERAAKVIYSLDYDSTPELHEEGFGLSEEDLEDQKAFDAAAADSSEPVPHAVFDRILAGENPVRAYRKWRGLTQAELAATVSIAPKYLSQIETGRRNASLGLNRRLAAALGVDLDDLLN